jgi:hypothetical protein
MKTGTTFLMTAVKVLEFVTIQKNAQSLQDVSWTFVISNKNL